MSKSIFNVPAPIVVYNLFMNGVDRFDQLRSTNPCQRKEMRVTMTMFTYLIDAAIQNAFTIHSMIDTEQSFDCLREFKRSLSMDLVGPWVEHVKSSKKRPRSSTPQYVMSGGPELTFDNPYDGHLLLGIISKKSS